MAGGSEFSDKRNTSPVAHWHGPRRFAAAVVALATMGQAQIAISVPAGDHGYAMQELME